MSVRWLSNRWLSIVAAVLSAVLAFSTANAGEAELRTWKSSSGKFEIEATFVEFASNDVGILVVVLKKKDGETIKVPLDKLSQSDLNYVDSQEQASLNPSPAPLEEPNLEERPEFGPGQSDEPESELLDGKGTDAGWANDGWTEIDDVDWKFTSRMARAALKTYSTAMKKHVDRSKQEAEQQRKKFVKVLEGIQRTLTEAGDLVRAVKVRDAVETLVKWHQIPDDKIAPIAVKKYRKEAVRVRDVIAALRDGNSPPTKRPSTKRKKSLASKVDVPKQAYLDDVQELQRKTAFGLGKHGESGYGPGHPIQRIQFRGKDLKHSLAVHPPSDGFSFVDYNLGGNYHTFQGVAAIMDNGVNDPKTTLVFKVIGDSRLLWSSEGMKKRGAGQRCRVNIRKVKTLRLRVDCPGAWDSAHTIWISPQVSR